MNKNNEVLADSLITEKAKLTIEGIVLAIGAGLATKSVLNKTLADSSSVATKVYDTLDLPKKMFFDLLSGVGSSTDSKYDNLSSSQKQQILSDVNHINNNSLYDINTLSKYGLANIVSYTTKYSVLDNKIYLPFDSNLLQGDKYFYTEYLDGRYYTINDNINHDLITNGGIASFYKFRPVYQFKRWIWGTKSEFNYSGDLYIKNNGKLFRLYCERFFYHAFGGGEFISINNNSDIHKETRYRLWHIKDDGESVLQMDYVSDTLNDNYPLNTFYQSVYSKDFDSANEIDFFSQLNFNSVQSFGLLESDVPLYSIPKSDFDVIYTSKSDYDSILEQKLSNYENGTISTTFDNGTLTTDAKINLDGQTIDIDSVQLDTVNDTLTSVDSGIGDVNEGVQETNGLLGSIKTGINSIKDFLVKDIPSFFSTVINYLNPASDVFLGGTILDKLLEMAGYLNPTSDLFLLNPVLDWFGTFPSILGNVLNPVLDFLGDIVGYLNPFSDTFFLKLAFIPNDLFFQGFFTDINIAFNDKIPIFIQLKDLFNNVLSISYSQKVPEFKFSIPDYSVYNQDLIKFNQFTNYRTLIVNFIRFSSWFVFLKRIFKKLPKVVY